MHLHLYLHLHLSVVQYCTLTLPPVLDMLAGIGDPTLPADHVVNRPELAAAHLTLINTFFPGD